MERFVRSVGNYLESKRRVNNIGRIHCCGCDYEGPDCGYGSPRHSSGGMGCGYGEAGC